MTTTLGTVEAQTESAGAAPRRHRRITVRSLTGQVLLYGMLVLLALVYIYPFLVQVATSFKTEPDAAPTRSR
jgi:multiple sugar transport system permease protein